MRHPSVPHDADDTYDYVVVGAGSAGCVLAGRLSEDRSCRVLLIEAGPKDRALRIRVPAAYASLFRTRYDWDYLTEPQRGLGHRVIPLARGRVLGGTSSLNAQVYIRDRPEDFEQWNVNGWSYDDLLPFFRAGERNSRGADSWHGDAGPQYVEDPRDPQPITEAFLRAAEQTGLRRVADLNAPWPGNVVALAQLTQHEGRRWSSADAYLRPALGRSNLTVTTDALCMRVDLTGRRATGVTYRTGTRRRRAVARREVVLSAGAIGTPHLLQVSGIGPPALLRRAGVDVLHSLSAVGAHLRDHLVATQTRRCLQPVSLYRARNPLHLAHWLLRHRGPLTSNVGEALAYLSSAAHVPTPDLELFFTPIAYHSNGYELPRGHAVSVAAVLVQPRSCGTVRLTGPDATAPPAIDPGYLSDPADMATFVPGIRAATRVLRAPMLARHLADWVVPSAPAESDADIEAFAKERATTMYHPVGSCRMGDDPSTSVVDAALRVHGLTGLRVVDASVFPHIGRGHPHATVLAVAERAATQIRAGR